MKIPSNAMFFFYNKKLTCNSVYCHNLVFTNDKIGMIFIINEDRNDFHH